MLEFLQRLTDTSDFPARWYCGRWTDAHGWLHIVSDLAIFSAYMMIPLLLIWVIRRRPGRVPFRGVLALFCLFVFSCGLTHLMESIIFWKPMYRLAGTLKFTTAAVSWATVAALVPAVPRMLAMRHPESLEEEVQQRTRDLEERRAELEAARAELATVNEGLHAKRAELEQVIYTVSHDLRAPVVSILNYLDLAEEEGVSGGAEQPVARARGAADRCLGLLRGVLDVSRAGMSGVVKQTVQLDELVLAAAEVADVQVEPDNPRGEVLADPSRLQEVLENLLTNAKKYGAPPFRVSVERDDAAVQVTVSDGGPGIPPEMAERVFELFARLPSGQDGDGIGLSIVRRVVQAHGGTARAEVGPDGGAAIVVRLPHE